MEHHSRHAAVWHILRPIVRLVVRIKFNYSCPVYRLRGPYIVVSNHVTDWDPLLVGSAFRRQMYFLASEHILRWGLKSKLLDRYIHPITRQKGGSAAGAVKAILRAVKDGCNVAFFPEGNRTWDGVTRDFPESTGKLIRTSGAGLVTFRLTGGYFSSPRWSGNSIRRGRAKGEIVRIFTPEQLKTMSVDEINAAIRKDIAVDAYAERKVHPFPYRGKALAEHLETFLYVCPCCGASGRIESKDDVFRCKACGKSARYSPSGIFSENGFPFDNVRDWGIWQTEQYAGLIEKVPSDEPVFRDGGFELYSVESAKSREFIAHGDIALYRDRLDLPGDVSIPLTDITGMSLQGPERLYIGTANGNSFFLDTAKICCTEKYLEVYSLLGCRLGNGV